MKSAWKPAVWAGSGTAVTLAVLMAVGMLHPGGDDGDENDQPVAAEASGTDMQDGTVTLDAAQLAHAAITAQAVAVGSTANVRQGFALVLDLSPLAAIEADLATARSALTASRAEAARLTALEAQDQSASKQAVEAARALASADAARLALAERRIGLEFGPGLTRMDAAARGRLISAAGAGQAALLRVDIPGVSLSGGARVEISDGQGHQSVRLIGPAASTDPQLQGAAMLAILPAPLAARAMTGRQFNASATGGGTQSGILVPRSALIRWQGGLWLYRQTGQHSFARVAVDDARPAADGWLVPHGLSVGDRIVTDGAATLFAIERGGSAGSDDD